eukprot:3956464-Lingulodinium_polyedra.AAC.1
MVKGSAKAAVAKEWQESIGEGLTNEADEATCVKVHEAMGQAMNVGSAFSGREDQKACCWAADYADTWFSRAES